ncbi:MAG TPA: hypothetical protein PKD44_08610 [Nitrosomonas sp.]|nr:hypothetical protein [Nitrosomonas sp.]HNB02443.1 hypothetical protein [Nitrosomonas sp.]
MLIDHEVAHKALAPYYGPLWNIVSSGWNDWQSNHISPEYKMSLSDRTRACIINDRMRYAALRTTESDSSVQCVIHQQMFVLVITPSNFDGCIGIRLKKLSANGFSRNQQTKQVKNFKGQILLPAIAADYHLEVGYVIDEFGQELKSIDLVCPSGKGIYWKSEITPKNSLQKSHIIEQDLFNDVVVIRKNIIGEKSEDTGTS